MKKLNITLPSDLVKDLETMLDKNRFVADAVKEKLEREKSAELEELLIPVVNPSNNQQFVQKTKVLL